MGAADDVDQDERVERDERRGLRLVDSAPGGESRDDPGQSQHRDRRDRLQHRDRQPDRQPGEGVGHQGEQRAVGARGVGPGDVGEGRVVRRRVGGVDVGVEPVAHAEPGVVEVAEGVVREEHRGAGEGDDEDDDQRPDDGEAEPRGGDEHAEVGEEPRPHQSIGKTWVDGELTAGFFAAARPGRFARAHSRLRPAVLGRQRRRQGRRLLSDARRVGVRVVTADRALAGQFVFARRRLRRACPCGSSPPRSRAPARCGRRSRAPIRSALRVRGIPRKAPRRRRRASARFRPGRFRRRR